MDEDAIEENIGKPEETTTDFGTKDKEKPVEKGKVF